jgi:hypothetical protein
VVEKSTEEQSVKLEKANHLKGWDAKPLASFRENGKAAGLPGENPSSQKASVFALTSSAG